MSGMFDEWDLYSRIVRGDYMHHEEISSQIRGILAEVGRPLRVLDAGCGDGMMARRCLGQSTVERYVGIDLSADALSRLRGVPPTGSGDRPAEVILLEDDLLRGIRAQNDEEFEVVLASYSIHHLPQPGKEEFLHQVRRILKKPVGLFFWSDSYRSPGESRAEYLDRLTAEIRTNWPALSAGEADQTVEHIRQSDFPEDDRWMTEASRACGLDLRGNLFRSPYFGCWYFGSSLVGAKSGRT